MESERRAKSDMEHQACLRLEATERATLAERAEQEAKGARASAEMLAESLRIQVSFVLLAPRQLIASLLGERIILGECEKRDLFVPLHCARLR